MRKTAPSLLPALVVCGCLCATGILHTWQRVEGIRLGYRVGEVTSEHQTLMRRNEHLRLEVATLKAPSRIERLAREHFDMRPPRPSQVVVVRSSARPHVDEETLPEEEAGDELARVGGREEPRG